MRRVVFSVTARDQLGDLLEQGLLKFGAKVAAEKRALLYHTVEVLLAQHPRVKKPDPKLGLVVYSVTNTPFAVVYDFDNDELRIHYVLHYRDDTRDLNPSGAVWD